MTGESSLEGRESETEVRGECADLRTAACSECIVLDLYKNCDQCSGSAEINGKELEIMISQNDLCEA